MARRVLRQGPRGPTRRAGSTWTRVPPRAVARFAGSSAGGRARGPEHHPREALRRRPRRGRRPRPRHARSPGRSRRRRRRPPWPRRGPWRRRPRGTRSAPGPEGACCADPALTGVQAQHHPPRGRPRHACTGRRDGCRGRTWWLLRLGRVTDRIVVRRAGPPAGGSRGSGGCARACRGDGFRGEPGDLREVTGSDQVLGHHPGTAHRRHRGDREVLVEVLRTDAAGGDEADTGERCGERRSPERRRPCPPGRT